MYLIILFLSVEKFHSNLRTNNVKRGVKGHYLYLKLRRGDYVINEIVWVNYIEVFLIHMR